MEFLTPRDTKEMPPPQGKQEGEPPPPTPLTIQVGAVPPARLTELVEGYEFLSVIGRGGMGVVYQAHQKNLDRTVAIKVLSPSLMSDEVSLERFKREAKAMAKFNHPHIVSVFDHGETSEGHCYIVMEYLQGKSLADYLRKSELTVEALLEWMPQVCEALAYAHGKGIVHRDIKPANVLIDPIAGAKIADFGMARLVPQHGPKESSLTDSRFAVGTMHYIAPEAMQRKAVTDHRIDIYALGVMLYELLTGHVPRGSWVAPSAEVKGLDIKFDEVVIRAMAPNPENRYPNAIEMGQAIAKVRPPKSRSKAEARVGTVAEMGTAAHAPGTALHRRPASTRMKWTALISGIAVAVVAATYLAIIVIGRDLKAPGSVNAIGSSDSAVASGSSDSQPALKIPDPPSEGPVRVILVAGQGAVDGLGWAAQLENTFRTEPSHPVLQGLRSEENWITRPDVWLARSAPDQGDHHGFLDPFVDRCSNPGGTLGICLGAGTVIGNAVEEPVLILRVSSRPAAVASEFRPARLAEVLPRPYDQKRKQGLAYRYWLSSIHRFLLLLPEMMPSHHERGFEISAVIWFQGWNDSKSPQFAQDYGVNLAEMMVELRMDLGTPDLPVIIGEFSPRGEHLGEEEADRLERLIREQQRAFPLRPNFLGSSAFVETATLHNPANKREGIEEYSRDAITLMMIGQALGRATLDFLPEKAEDRSQAVLEALQLATAREDGFAKGLIRPPRN